jgi:hypothetical protein
MLAGIGRTLETLADLQRHGFIVGEIRGMKIVSGHKCCASTSAIAERTASFLAS